MTLATPDAPNTYLRFVECCTGNVILFRGSLPIVSGSVYSYIGSTPFAGTGGNLEPNKCYTIFIEFTTDNVPYSPAPTMPVLAAKLSCEDPTCPSCNPPLPCECPPGFQNIDGECTKVTTTTASYSGSLFELDEGDKSQYYCDFGLRLYPEITSMTWPLLGNGSSNSNYIVSQNNGAGPTVVPTANVQSEVWGKGTNPCSTGNTGGRLNIAGVWALNYPFNQELAFEFCINITGETPKQYMLGIAGDNYVKFYVDGNLAVFLNTPNQGVTVPFRHWHVFPITLTPGNHTIKLAGLNLGGNGAFAAEIYDITLSLFQSTLMNPAIAAGNCGTSPAQLEPYILFSTRDMVGQSVANPNQPGVWSCPDGGEVDFCNGVPTCTIVEKINLACDCYMIIPCNNTSPAFVSNNPDFDPYIDQFITVTSENYNGCAFIVKLDDNDCLESVDASPIDTPCSCDLRCFYVEGTNGFLYVDNDNVLQEVSALDASPYLKVCSKVYPVPENDSVNYQIIELANCDEGTGECKTLCFKLTSCDDPENIIYSNSDTLIPYVYGTNNVVQILNREGCWVASELDPDEICDCPIDITVTSSYVDCEECKGYISYKLRSCTTNDVIYTLQDLEQYLDQVIKIDCGCYTIEKLDILPPNPQTILIEDTYTTCTECTRVYWELTDCQGVADPIITYTDLSGYVGDVIKIENCDECWEINPTDLHEGAVSVVVTQSFIDCEACNTNLPCICTVVTNSSIYPRKYGYLDCDKNYHEIELQSGECSERICAIKWYSLSYCECFTLKVSIEVAPGQIVSNTYFANAIPGQTSNGYPVYSLCDYDNCGTVSFNGTSWVAYDNSNNPLYILVRNTSETCPFGIWYGFDGQPIPNTTIESYACPEVCTCVTVSVTDPVGVVTNTVFTFLGTDQFENAIYVSADFQEIRFNQQANCWLTQLPIVDYVTFCESVDCPIGLGEMIDVIDGYTIVSTKCYSPRSNDFLPTDHFQTFGECKNGVCPPPVFKNNRTVKPGYNTPICTPEKYDMITCNFADVLYKIALEKRYGITNCCPDDNDRWLIEKELIDLQALKDPNYNCAECACGCNPVNTCTTCNCKN